VVSGVTLILFGYQIDFYLYDDFPTSPALLFWGILAISALGYMMMGLIFGIAYSSSESDVRATYPDRLVSLDALLAGRIFSRNVARSVLVGAALGGWALLAERLFLLPFAMRADGGQGLSENTWTIFGGSLISFAALLTPPFSGVTVAVLGLLLPLAFLRHRRIRSQKIFLLSLALLCLVANLQISLDRPVVLSAGFLIAATLAGILLIAFFFFDVLTAIVAIAALSLVSWLTYLTSQPAGSLRQTGIITLFAALLILLVETYFLFRGRLYSEADVRPLYARFLAERVQLQAEESAAREAQVRLMPQQLPTTAGLELAAVCHPAHTVGGDFYDLFPLADDCLGLFVAEGGGGGLGSALTIAFAKGFLMPRVASGAAPGDIICSLQSQLAPMLQSNEELTIAFAIIDPHRKTISYARTGEYPLVHVERADDSNGASTFALTESVREWTGEHANERETKDGCTIREASLQLSAGDSILFFTDGIGKTLRVEHASPNKLMRDVTKHLTRKAGHTLQDALGKTVAKQARQARRINMDDDLTAVVIRFTQTAY
jgi:serine phosphatase RsbU (regulator of sigma subunit)